MLYSSKVKAYWESGLKTAANQPEEPGAIPPLEVSENPTQCTELSGIYPQTDLKLIEKRL